MVLILFLDLMFLSIFKQCILTNLVTQCNFVEFRLVHSEYAWTQIKVL